MGVFALENLEPSTFVTYYASVGVLDRGDITCRTPVSHLRSVLGTSFVLDGVKFNNFFAPSIFSTKRRGKTKGYSYTGQQDERGKMEGETRLRQRKGPLTHTNAQNKTKSVRLDHHQLANTVHCTRTCHGCIHWSCSTSENRYPGRHTNLMGRDVTVRAACTVLGRIAMLNQRGTTAERTSFNPCGPKIVITGVRMYRSGSPSGYLLRCLWE